ncbi:MAG: hypothetical protein LBK62_06320 [Treponema sp.]|jgi:hypothetical protein|nr:hypothetical protein [Treponema sp.]
MFLIKKHLKAGLFFSMDKGQAERYTFKETEITALRAVLDCAGLVCGSGKPDSVAGKL